MSRLKTQCLNAQIDKTRQVYTVPLAENFPLTFYIIQLDHSYFFLPLLSKYYWRGCLNTRCVHSCAVTEVTCQVICVRRRYGAPRWSFLHRTNRPQPTLAIVIAAR